MIIKPHHIIFCIAMATLLMPFSQIKAQRSKSAPDLYTSAFENEHLLYELFDKLQGIKSGEGKEGKKVNIVHIGDSHIQADFLTNTVRQQLQHYFGNGGYGFTFPYSIAKTNGTKRIKYSTNVDWASSRNVDRVSDVPIGLGGIALSTNFSNFFMTLNSDIPFDRIRVLSSSKESCFLLSSSVSAENAMPTESIVKVPSRTSYHRVKRGETLFRLSVNYKVSVDDIKRANGLKSNNIKIGQMVKIPQKNGTVTVQTKPLSRITAQDTLSGSNENYYVEYNSPYPITDINIIGDGSRNAYNLNGIVIEDASASGVIYHTIGINGAKVSDFNKYPLFFEQLPVLSPDLVIVSLGTNESFGNLTATSFMSEVERLVSNIRQKHPGIPIIISTPPPSLRRRRLINTYLTDYVKQIKAIKDCSVWDLYSKVGGANAPKAKNASVLMAKDKIHYTSEGYRQHGNILATDLIKAYENYIKVKSSVEHEIRY